MSEPLLNEVCTTLANMEAIEKACNELGVTLLELRTELARHPAPANTLSLGDARSLIRRTINERNLRDAALETQMPTSAYLALQNTLTISANAVTSLRDDVVISKDEFARRGRVRIQGNLFDEQEEVPHSAKHSIRDDGGNYPLG